MIERQDDLDNMTMEELNTKASIMLNQKVNRDIFWLKRSFGLFPNIIQDIVTL